MSAISGGVGASR